jgi:formylglycine-generating enzyme required for sulfatase activity
MRNTPVPPGPRAPVNAKWLLAVAPPAAVIAAYRMIPAKRRAHWNNGVSTSHDAMAAVLAGGGWKALARYATPQLRTRRQPRFALAWALFLASAVLGLNMAKQQSWAN